MSDQLKTTQDLSSHPVTCAYCHHQRTYMRMTSKLPLEGVEHIWCPKCSCTFKYDRGTDTAYTLETIQMKQEANGNHS